MSPDENKAVAAMVIDSLYQADTNTVVDELIELEKSKLAQRCLVLLETALQAPKFRFD